jgi:hypothetical protein
MKKPTAFYFGKMMAAKKTKEKRPDTTPASMRTDAPKTL